ncbi:MAG: nucleoside deaminase [Bryobacterales bacterium]|nr:nucleoside deaminase [Bryobacterales bacterium]
MNPAFMARAIELALENVRTGRGGPFGAVVVKDGVIIGEGANSVIPLIDPTAHAEVVALRNACAKLGVFHIPGSEVYTSCEPCPMCLGAIYWAHVDRVYFAATKDQAAEADFDDSFIYRQIEIAPEQRSIPMLHVDAGEDALRPFAEWLKKPDRIRY